MKRLEIIAIEPTKSTPMICFDPDRHILQMKGQSYPENVITFYEPLLEWVDAYLQQLPNDQPVKLEIQLHYINTSSTKCLMMLLEKFEEAYLQGKSIQVVWLYDEENESEFECAEEFKEDLSLPFEIEAQV